MGLTYQRMINKMFKYYIWRNVEVYIYDMIVKSKTTDLHLVDLTEMFQVLKKFNMRLNISKYALEVGSRKFLEFIK